MVVVGCIPAKVSIDKHTHWELSIMMSNAELPLTPNLLPLTGFVMWPYNEYILVPRRREWCHWPWSCDQRLVPGRLQPPCLSRVTRMGTAPVNQDWWALHTPISPAFTARWSPSRLQELTLGSSCRVRGECPQLSLISEGPHAQVRTPEQGQSVRITLSD